VGRLQVSGNSIYGMNNAKTVGLLGILTALLFWIGYYLPGGGGLGTAIAFAAIFNFIAYFFSDKMALMATGARPVTEEQLPDVYSIMRRLTTATNMPMPRIYVIDSPQPNAFATGRNPRKAAVAVTTGILGMLDHDELEGVLAHELAHVRNRDILISSIAAMLGAAISILMRMTMWGGGRSSDRDNPLGAIGFLVSLIIAPLAAMLIRFAISRTREFQADHTGAEITGRPLKLASALEKISAGASRIPMQVDPAHSQLFIENPLKALRGGGVARMFSTHPPTEERIQRLRDMAQGITR
jgi:heat shock protein HtpX